MINKKSMPYILLTSLGFFAAIAVGLFIFFRVRHMAADHSKFSRNFYEEYVSHIKRTTLADMAEYIEKQYPELLDTALLKREAGTDRFWELSAELNKISKSFDFACIHFIEKAGNNYIFLMSSEIQKDENPGWLGGPVWKEAPPAFVEEAWETKQVSFSREPTINEWGKLISASRPELISVARPILSDGEVAGILGIDYHDSFLDDLIQQELFLEQNEDTMVKRIRDILILSVFIIVGFMGYQIWLSTTTTRVSSKEIESDKRTRLMLDTTPMICSLWDTKGNLIDCNQETLNIFGIPDKSECLKRYYEFIPEYQPDGEYSRSVILRHSKEVSERGYKHFEWMYCTETGEPLPVEITLVRVPWNNDWRIACYARDLREEKAKEGAARESENRLRVMLDTMAIPCFFFDPEGNILECNQQTINLFGSKDKKEFLDNFFDFSPEYQSDGRRSRDKVKDVIRYVFETGKRDVFLWNHIRGDGTPLPVEVHTTRVEWKNGFRGVAFLRDLSNLMETEENLRRVLALVEASPNLITYLGADGNIEYMNPSVSDLSGFSRAELRKDGLALMFSPGDFKNLYTLYIAAGLKKQQVFFDMSVICKNGAKREVSFSVVPVQQYDGNFGVGLIGKDITDLKRMQRELEAAKDQAERALESEVQYSKAKSDFLSRVSHELRTPLNAILGVTNLGEKAVKKEEMDLCCFKIKEATNHLLGLVNDILDMTGFDTDRFSFSPKPFSFNKMMDSVVDHVTQMAKAKKQVFFADIDGGIQDWIESDERRMKQVLMNLLSNAIKFTPEKGVIQLSAQMTAKNDNECTIRFEVADNGIGIAPEALERLWQIFEQVDNSITREHGGMGLGLPLTKRIVDLMQGELWISSEPGKGSRFTCEVRVGVAQVLDQGTDVANPLTGSILPMDISLNGKRVLVVDDIEINRDILLAMLEETGAILDAACNGEEALKMFTRNKYDLVLMDLHMPVMDGFTAAKSIRTSAQSWAKSIPIISVSAETGVELHCKCLEAGINEHLPKPVEVQALFGIISKWVTRTATAPEAV